MMFLASIFLKPAVRMAFKILSFLLYFFTLLAAFGGFVNPAHLVFPAFFITAMPYFVIATTVVIIIWFICGRWITAGIGVLTLLIAWSPVSTACPLHFSKKATPGAVTFKVLTYNILHGDDQQKGNDVPGNRSFEYVINSGADIVCLQEMINLNDPNEVHNLAQFKDTLKKVYPYWAGSNLRDQKVLSKYPIRMIDHEVFFKAGDRSRFSAYKVTIKGRELTLINMHLNSYALSDKERNIVKDFASGKAKEALGEFKNGIWSKFKFNLLYRADLVNNMRMAIDKVNGPLIICGDFNDVPESYCYRLLKGDDLKDAYVETGFGPLVTYNRHAFWFHLDQIFYRGPLKALDVEKGRIRSSDHYPLLATFEFTNTNQF
ncbi:MAG: endonuclease/exonuclease/phosphatase family protein [Muribaculaceae bacterium]|nr:endonuclease/exonuclease/phosphatase family protein [Muribaculaceae bacterium]